MLQRDSEPDLSPSPSRLVESLRDTGYSHQAAFADIVDNSIAADASMVKIEITESVMGDEVIVAFYDNGSGMDSAELLNAMRYGSEKRPSPKSLGKFGMGLKTASTAFCRRVTVISKKNGATSLCCWDIDYIIQEDKWKLYPADISNYGSEIDVLDEVIGAGNGTAVIWSKIDRLIAHSGLEYSTTALAEITLEIREHLSATFGKFLNKSANEGRVEIYLNDELMEGWNPTGIFLNTVEQPERVISQNRLIPVSLKDGMNSIECVFELNGYVLPNKSNMTSEELKKIRYSNDNQGFFIYRENRLIYSGGWPHRLLSQDAHQNLLRIELNFDHRLDDYFGVDIRKSNINFPQSLRSEIKKIITPWKNEAQSRYRRSSLSDMPSGNLTGEEDVAAANESNGVSHRASSAAIGRHESGNTSIEVISYDENSQVITIKNRFGEYSLNRAEIVKGTDIFVTTKMDTESAPLWDVAFNGDQRPVVVLNENHEFYRRFYRSSEINPILVQAMDSLLWSFANAEMGSVSDKARKNYEELRMSVSTSLRKLSKELPDVEV